MFRHFARSCRRYGRRCQYLLIAIASVLIAINTHAADSISNRTQLQKIYINQIRHSPSPFGSRPITQITPQNNRSTVVGMAGNSYNVVVGPENATAKVHRTEMPIRLEIGGWDSTITAAFSTDKIGIGVLAESGKRQVEYTELARDRAVRGNVFGAMENYGGGALFFFLLPKHLLPSRVYLNSMVGFSKVLVTHKTNGGASGAWLETYEYEVGKTHAGGDLLVKVGKIGGINVWYNYLATKIGEDSLVGPPKPLTNYNEYHAALGLDQELFWNAQPRQRLGIDFIVTLIGFDVHLGGGLAYLAGKGSLPRHMLDDTLSIGLSYSF